MYLVGAAGHVRRRGEDRDSEQLLPSGRSLTERFGDRQDGDLCSVLVKYIVPGELTGGQFVAYRLLVVTCKEEIADSSLGMHPPMVLPRELMSW
jgi:hypothetical protein